MPQRIECGSLGLTLGIWHRRHRCRPHEFGFTLDVCATPENAKCARYYTKAQDGLAQEWQGVCWMNPPYGREMVGWLKRAEAEKANGVTTVALIPSRTNTGWWHDIVMPNEVRFVRGRPKFGNADQGLPWPLAVIIFRANAIALAPPPQRLASKKDVPGG